MDWLEIIELRTVNGIHKKMESTIRSIIEDFRESAADYIVRVYNRFGLESDISIHIINKSEKPDINGSQAGMQLVSSLKEFGLTNHSIWIKKCRDVCVYSRIMQLLQQKRRLRILA